MTRYDQADLGFDPRIADWFEADLDRAPDQVLDTVLAALPSIQQRRAWRVPWRFPEMFDPTRSAAAAIPGVLLIGGVLFLLPRPGPTEIGGGVNPSPSPTVSPSPSLHPSPSQGRGACSLVKPDEAERIAGVAGLGAASHETGTDPETTCFYRTGEGNNVLVLIYTQSGGAAAFQTARRVAGVRVITGLGDGAVFDPATNTTTFLSGDASVAVVAGSGRDSAETRLAVERQIAALALPRLIATP
jgi:hypothetical protein